MEWSSMAATTTFGTLQDNEAHDIQDSRESLSVHVYFSL